MGLVGGVLLIGVGCVFMFFGVGAMTSGTYDTAGWVHVLIGVVLGLPGLALAIVGFRLVWRDQAR